jgi:hypothetical protein
MKNILVLLFTCITIVTIVYTYQITNKNEENYVKEVHAHMASIMFFHLLIISIFIANKPAILNNTYVSILNTALSIMFSILFYITDPKNKKLAHTYNALYLFFASILVAEVIDYFDYENIIYLLGIIYIMFIADLTFYKKENRINLLVSFVSIFIISLSSGVVYGREYMIYAFITALYGIVVLAYMYYDHDYLEGVDKKNNHLNDSLKYFLDFEGTIIRTLSNI